ncbi:DUF84 family protein [Bacillus massiliigorillae]|uniref:DUF84 family protein n=1 Tax=Bacillus massiliigorillae TaxID=1243664 RepID=UPI0003AAE35F|nr:DUF84 family protein [Bacillus massiliigorillae]
MIIAIGSRNPAKVEAVSNVVEINQNKVLAVDVPSGVSNQPFSDEETIKGAINRAKASLMETSGQIGIGLEGGVVETPYGLFLCNWGALVTNKQEPIIAGGARIPLPEEIAIRLRQGEELGPIMDEYTKKKNIRKKEGAIGVFTNEEISRIAMFEHIVKMLIGQYKYQQQRLHS